MRLSSFLRTVLKLDAASCLLMAALLFGASGSLSPMLGLPQAMLAESGILLAIVGAFILWLGTRKRAPHALVGLVVFGNLGWVASSIISLVVVPEVTTLGVAAILAQAAAVLAFAALEWRGLRESAVVAAA